MYSIAICDDEEVLCLELKQILEEYEGVIPFTVDIFHSGEKLCQAFAGGREYDLVFLDIELEEMNGVEVGRSIRETFNNEQTQIVYISAKQEYAMELFAVRPLNFLIKPFSAQEVYQNVDKAMRLFQGYESHFEFQIEKIIHRVKIGDILHFESKRRQVMLFTINGEYCFYGVLNQIEKETNNRFIRLHRSYLVNPLHVKEYQYDKVILNDHTEIPISKPYRSVVRQQLRKNWGER